jgi:hypothetical protein
MLALAYFVSLRNNRNLTGALEHREFDLFAVFYFFFGQAHWLRLRSGRFAHG